MLCYPIIIQIDSLNKYKGTIINVRSLSMISKIILKKRKWEHSIWISMNKSNKQNRKYSKHQLVVERVRNPNVSEYDVMLTVDRVLVNITAVQCHLIMK